MELEQLIQQAAALGASDLHLAVGLPPKLRVDGSLTDLEGYPSLTDEDCQELAAFLTGDQAQRLIRGGELDFSRTIAGTRIRGNLFRQQGHLSIALRLLSDTIPDLNTLGLPSAALEFPQLNRGIVLVTGETGSGKSTTLAAVLQRINETRRKHIITLEDPIEYIHTPRQCLISQREIGSDTASYADGLRAVLREDPDIILIGEMRDLTTIETALTAAETGHLVFATLHTNSAADSIDRMVDVFPQGRQRQIRMQLSMTLQAVLSQQLLPHRVKGRVLACELMVVNSAIRNLIREGKTPQIANSLATSADQGGITMDNSILRLYRQRLISAQTACAAAHDPERMKKAAVL